MSWPCLLAIHADSRHCSSADLRACLRHCGEIGAYPLPRTPWALVPLRRSARHTKRSTVTDGDSTVKSLTKDSLLAANAHVMRTVILLTPWIQFSTGDAIKSDWAVKRD